MTDYLCKLVLSNLDNSGNTVVEQSIQIHNFKHSNPATGGTEGGKWQESMTDYLWKLFIPGGMTRQYFLPVVEGYVRDPELKEKTGLML